MEGGWWPRATASPSQGFGQPPAIGLVPAVVGGRLPLLSSPFSLPSPPLFLSFFLSFFPCSSSSSLGNDKAGQGRPVGRLPGAGGGRRSQLEPSEPAGILPGPNQAADWLGSVVKGGPLATPLRPPRAAELSFPLPLPLPLRPPRVAGHSTTGTVTGGSAAPPDLPLYLSISLLMKQWKGGLPTWMIAMDGGRRLLSSFPFIVEEKGGGGVEKEGAVLQSLSCLASLLLPLFHPFITWGFTLILERTSKWQGIILAQSFHTIHLRGKVEVGYKVNGALCLAFLVLSILE